MKLKMFTDGGARGNPGPAAVGILICDENDETLLELGEVIGEATNNIAEYRALITGLQEAKKLGGSDVLCYLDSELVVKQMSGKYKVKNYNLQKLYDEGKRLEREFSKVSYAHLRREEDGIQRADQLVNYALDEAERNARNRR